MTEKAETLEETSTIKNKTKKKNKKLSLMALSFTDFSFSSIFASHDKS
jgi:hypothetical protein